MSTITIMEDALDHYLILGVSPTASTSELYMSYCVAVKQWLQSDDSFNHGILTRLQESYRVLQDPIRRAAFHTESYGKHMPYTKPEKDRMVRNTKKKKKLPKWKNLKFSR